MGNRPDLDEIDLAILRHLRKNSRMRFHEMSKLTGIPDATLQFRLKRMMEKGVIDKFTAIAKPEWTGYTVIALVLVQTDTDRHDEAKVHLAELPEISVVYSVLGEYDLFIKLWARSLDELNSLINDKIRSIDGIEDLLEIVVVERVKEDAPPV